MSTQPPPLLLEAEYLEIERKAEYKSEYWQGEMLAMSGASAPHCLISTNLLREASSQLRGRNCLTFGSDLRVRTGPGGLYCYPDFTIVCGGARFHDSHNDTLENPTLIGEILSPSTELYDRVTKFARYRRIASLRQYLLLAQDRPHVELFTRLPDGRWAMSEADGLEAAIELESVGCTLALRDLYDLVDFDKAAPATA